MVVHWFLQVTTALTFICLGGQYNSESTFEHVKNEQVGSRQDSTQVHWRKSYNRQAGSSLRTELECEVDNDLIMVLDSSAGMKEDEFRKAKGFLAEFAAAFNPHKQNRLGFKVFAVQPQTIFELTNIHTPSEMKTHIETAPYFGKTQKDAYFHYALLDSFNELKHLNRSLVDQNFLLITAGPGKKPEKIALEAAKMIKAGVNNFVVGIGERVVKSQLLTITGDKSENLVLTTDVDELKRILDKLVHLVCSNKAPVCHGKNELMVSLDASSSVSSGTFKRGKQFAAVLFDSFVMSGTNRVSFRTFSTNDKSIFKLDNSLTRAQVQSTVLSANQGVGHTRTDLSLDAGVAEFKLLDRGVSKNLLVITDGKSEFPTLTKEAAQRAKAAGINTYAVGIGSVLDAELLNIANGDPKRVFKFEKLDEKILKKISEEICAKKP